MPQQVLKPCPVKPSYDENDQAQYFPIAVWCPTDDDDKWSNEQVGPEIEIASIDLKHFPWQKQKEGE